MRNYKIWIIGILAVIVDLAIYIFLGLVHMMYTDFYDESQGEYESWGSYSSRDKAVVVGINVWYVLNLLLVGYVLYRVIKRWRSATAQPKSIS